MKKNYIVLFLFSLLALSAPIKADNQIIPDRMILGVCDTMLYAGDSQGEFVGDLVVMLNDGSQWKVHPKYKDYYNQWYSDEIVSLRVRQPNYWFKREHHFTLYNKMRRVSIPVMLVKYPFNTAYVARQSDKPKAGFSYGKEIVLSDGTSWNCSDYKKLESFQNGTPVVILLNHSKTHYMMATGMERHAVYVTLDN